MILPERVSASAKLYLLLLIMSASIVGIGGYGIHEVEKMNRHTQTLYADRLIPIFQLTSVRFSYSAGILGAAVEAKTHRFAFGKARIEIYLASKNIKIKWNEYLKTTLSSEEKLLVQQISLLMHESIPTVEKLKDILKREDDEALQRLTNNELYPVLNPIMAKLNELVEVQVRKSEEINKNSNEANDIAFTRFYVLIILSLIVADSFSYVLIRNVKSLILDLHTGTEKIMESEKKYRNIFENVQDVFYQVSLKGIILDMSPSIENVMGYTRDELIGNHQSILYYNFTDREKGVAILKEKGALEDYELRLKSKSGQPVYVSLNARVIKGEGNIPTHIDGAFRNITERKKMEEKHRALIENISDAIILVDETGDIIYQSPSVSRIVGYSPEETKNKKVFDFVYPDDLQVSMDTFTSAFKSPNVPVQDSFRVRHKDGHYIWIEGSILNLLGNESVKSFVINYRDITDRKNAELKLEDTLLQLETRVEERTLELSIKNRSILDSITYAKRILEAKLPARAEVYAAFPQCFILFKPKDIVSGDFYFFQKGDEQTHVIAAADCTGHGVPGAFMSIIGSEKLTDAVSQSNNPSQILKTLNKGLKASLHQSDSDESTRDGMDIALCSIDVKNRIVNYSGANRPLWIIRNGQTEVEEIKATKKAIGGLTEDNQVFDSHQLQFQPGDTIYITTDGYADQIGGDKGKKLMTKNFKELLWKIQDRTMPEQAEYLDEFIESWKGAAEQVDDILVIGVRL